MTALCIAAILAAAAQTKPSVQAAAAPSWEQTTAQTQRHPAAPKPYIPVAIKPPQSAADPTFEVFRKQLADVARRKDRAALQKLVVSQGFFWKSESGEKANKHKSSFENFATAIELDDEGGSGWEIVAGAAAEPTLAPLPERKSVMCGPADPQINEKQFEVLVKATGTNEEEWGVPNVTGLEVHAAPEPDTPVIETLGMHFVRVIPEDDSTPPSMLRVVGPSGKVGFVPNAALRPLVSDKVCYLKGARGWKIAGYNSGLSSSSFKP